MDNQQNLMLNVGIGLLVVSLAIVSIVTIPKGSSFTDTGNDAGKVIFLQNTTCANNCGEINTASCDSYVNGQCDFAQKAGVDLQFKKLLNSTGLNILSNSSNVYYKTAFLNGTGIQITGSKSQTFTNTGVISNSCSSGVTCSGTNPSAISMATQSACSTNAFVTQVSGSSTCTTLTGTSPITVSSNAVSCSTCVTTSSDVAQWHQLTQSNITTSNVISLTSGTETAIACNDTASLLCGEYIKDANSQIYNKVINSISFAIKKVNTPTGTCTVGVFSNTGTLKYTAGTIDVSTLTTSFVMHTWTNYHSSYTTVVNDVIMMHCPSLQSGSNSVQISGETANSFDGTHTQFCQGNNNCSSNGLAWTAGDSTNGFFLDNLFTDVNFASKGSIYIHVALRVSGASQWGFDFNLDNGTNYADTGRYQANSGVVTGYVDSSVSQCRPYAQQNYGNGDRVEMDIWIYNTVSGDRKVAYVESAFGADTGASTSPNISEITCKWANTSNSITDFSLYKMATLPSGTTDSGNIATDSQVTVWGY